MCPKCRDEMQEVTTTIAGCLSCNGLWLSQGQPETFNHDRMEKFLDVGDTQNGERLDKLDTVGFLPCGFMMNNHYSLDGRLHFGRFDLPGRYFDAGEFTNRAETLYLREY